MGITRTIAWSGTAGTPAFGAVMWGAAGLGIVPPTIAYYLAIFGGGIIFAIAAVFWLLSSWEWLHKKGLQLGPAIALGIWALCGLGLGIWALSVWAPVSPSPSPASDKVIHGASGGSGATLRLPDGTELGSGGGGGAAGGPFASHGGDGGTSSLTRGDLTAKTTGGKGGVNEGDMSYRPAQFLKILSGLRDQYVSTHTGDNLTAMRSGAEWPPDEWVNAKLEAGNYDFRVKTGTKGELTVTDFPIHPAK